VVRLYERFYGGQRAEFRSDFALAESVQRLSEAVHATLFVVGGAPLVRGSAAERFVSVRRVVPGARNVFAPVFTGAFHEHDGRVVLRGSYSLDDATKLFVNAFLVACVLVAFLLMRAMLDEAALSYAPLFPLAMFAAGVALVRRAAHAGRRDAERISEVIARALRATPSLAALH
jgi:hypothetical protein